MLRAKSDQEGGKARRPVGSLGLPAMAPPAAKLAARGGDDRRFRAVVARPPDPPSAKPDLRME
jgi:hypothetical protein